jgi:pimeloyl-ACP methyl ester carboxylesterase
MSRSYSDRCLGSSSHSLNDADGVKKCPVVACRPGKRDCGMATYVLVHGGWSGAHGFRAVRRLLQEAGHEVFTPSLTGIGERVHLVSPQVGLTTHVQDVVNTLLYEDLRDAIVLGYSYGGAVVTGTVAHIGDRIRELVYLDAFVPSDGDTVSRLSGGETTPATVLGERWLIPPPPRDYDDPREAAWQTERRVPHPSRCFTEPVRVPTPIEEHPFGLTYIKATADDSDAPGGTEFWRAAAHARASDRWRYREIATNHMVASNRPHELVAILLELTDRGKAAERS